MIETILQHRSIRNFTSDPIPQNKVTSILDAGIRASNTGNMQVYSMVVTTDKDIREQLWEAHFKQEMVRVAPVHITFCADFNRFSKWCEQRNATPGYDNFLSFITAATDALLVSQNVALAAEANGLGICYLGTAIYNADRLISILNLPKLVIPVAAIVMGYPQTTPRLTDRLPLEAVIHNQTYKDYSSEAIDEFYKEKESLKMYQDIVRLNGKPTLAQVFTDKRYTKTDNVMFSRRFMDVLVKQEFMNNE